MDDTGQHLRAERLSTVPVDPSRVVAALDIAREHRSAVDLALERGYAEPALASAVQATRSALVGLAAAARFELVLTEGVPDAELDGALGAVVDTEWPELAHLVASFAESCDRLMATGASDSVSPRHTAEAAATADALIAALAGQVLALKRGG